jgi:peptidoglycan/xylan/chitin deacetylase (PgdA/CDA1 family)
MGLNFNKIPVLLPFSLLRKMVPVNPLIVNYHVVSDQNLPHIENLYKYRNVNTFIEDLDFFSSKFHPISLLELMENIRNNTVLPKNAILLTFDDGFKEVYEIVAPILVDKKLTATFFLTRNFIDNKELNDDNKKSLVIDCIKNSNDPRIHSRIFRILESHHFTGKDLVGAVKGIPYASRFVTDELARELNLDFGRFLMDVKPYMTRSQIQELIDAGFTFGSHSVDHARYAELSTEDQIRQTLESTDFITRNFGLTYRVFAFPYNDLRVSKSFFDAISGNVEASFGTRGLFKDPIDNNFQRISVEKSEWPAIRTVKFHYARRKVYQMLGKETIIR